MTANYCSSCGEQLRGGETFCPGCGVDLGAPASAPDSVQVEQGNAPNQNGRSPVAYGMSLAMLVGAGLFYMDGVKFMNSAARYQLDLFHALGIPVFVTGLASIVLIYGHLYQKMWGWRLTYFLYGGYLPLRVGTILYAGWFGARSVYTIPAMLLSLVVVIGLNEYRDVYA